MVLLRKYEVNCVRYFLGIDTYPGTRTQYREIPGTGTVILVTNIFGRCCSLPWSEL